MADHKFKEWPIAGGSLSGSIFGGPAATGPGQTIFGEAGFMFETQQEIVRLRTEQAALQKKLKEVEDDRDKEQETRRELESKVAEAEKKERLMSVLSRVGPRARSRIKLDESIVSPFFTEGPHETWVMSVDIRRSTDLMLKAEAKDFYEFISGLYSKFCKLVQNHFGVVDKFTGDGLLAFFPQFFTGPDAGLRAVMVADECHGAFRRHYADHRNIFQCVYADDTIGLGIGLDFGPVHIMTSQHELTIVGTPVVYACRFAGAPAGKTITNQRARLELIGKHAPNVEMTETQLDVKNEGKLVGYLVRHQGEVRELAEPEWLVERRESDSRPSPPQSS